MRAAPLPRHGVLPVKNMPSSCEVQSCISSIVAAFTSLRDAVKTHSHSSGGRGPGKGRSARYGPQLKASLGEASEAIRKEYGRGLANFGADFQKGDGEILHDVARLFSERVADLEQLTLKGT